MSNDTDVGRVDRHHGLQIRGPNRARQLVNSLANVGFVSRVLGTSRHRIHGKRAGSVAAQSNETVLTPMPGPGSMMDTPGGEACIEEVRRSSGARDHDGVGVAGRRDDRDAGSELGPMRERRVVGPEGQRVSPPRRADSAAMRPRPVVGPDRRRVPAAGRRAATLGMCGRPVVGPDGQRMPAPGCRAATAGMRQRVVVGSDRQRVPSAIGTAGRLIIGAAGNRRNYL
jgi:hypothetical protein